MKTTLIFLLLALMQTACGQTNNEAVYTLKIIGLDEYHVPLRVLIDSEEKAAFDDCGGGMKKIEVPESELKGKAIEAPGLITAKLLLPGGWTDIPVHVSKPTDFYREPNGAHGAEMVVDLRPKGLMDITLYIDNRGSNASGLSVGQLNLPLNPDSTKKVRIPVIGREEAAGLKVNDSALGTLPPIFNGYEGTTQFLVDITGNKKYKLYCVNYGYDNCKAPPQILKGKRIYQVSMIGYFLEPPPERAPIGGYMVLSDISNKS